MASSEALRRCAWVRRGCARASIGTTLTNLLTVQEQRRGGTHIGFGTGRSGVGGQRGLRGIGDSLYTPFSGPDGDDIDWDAYRALVRYCVGDLGHAMLWLTSGIGEWWSLTVDERKKLSRSRSRRHAVEPAGDPGVHSPPCRPRTRSSSRSHAQEHGADICYLQTPPMEVHAGEGVLRFFQYVADRTDIALGMFNSPSSGYVLTAPGDGGDLPPDPCGRRREGRRPGQPRAASAALHALAPELVIWECDLIVYRAGWLQDGIVGPPSSARRAICIDTPDRPWYTPVLAADLGRADSPTPSPSPGNRGLDAYQGCAGQLVHGVPGPARSTSRIGAKRSSTRPL